MSNAAADIAPPANVDDVVVLLPAHQNPFGAQCQIDRELQSILFNYEVRPQDVAILEDEGYVDRRSLRYVHPGGADDQRESFKECILDRMVGPALGLARRRISAAFCRMHRPDSLAAVVEDPAPPAKRTKADSAAPSSSKAAAEKSGEKNDGISDAKTGKKPVEKAGEKTDENSRKTGVDAALLSDVSSDSEDDGKAELDLDIPPRSSSSRDLPSLFNAMANEVFSFSFPSSCWFCSCLVGIILSR